MRVDRITIRRFKNLADLTIDFDEDSLSTVLIGRNGTGKTSLLARRIRDENRLVGPGTYLGQVYWGPKRVLQFALVFPNRLPSVAA